MTRRSKIILLFLLIVGEIVLHRYVHQLKLNMDLLYLILVYISVMSSFYKTMATATVVGLITDYFSGNILGVFGFSRILAAFLLNELSNRIDLKNNLFVFLLISVSLAFSNLMANVFLYFILGYSIQLSLVLYQPVLTGLIGLIIVFATKPKMYSDVY